MRPRKSSSSYSIGIMVTSLYRYEEELISGNSLSVLAICWKQGQFLLLVIDLLLTSELAGKARVGFHSFIKVRTSISFLKNHFSLLNDSDLRIFLPFIFIRPYKFCALYWLSEPLWRRRAEARRRRRRAVDVFFFYFTRKKSTITQMQYKCSSQEHKAMLENYIH